LRGDYLNRFAKYVKDLGSSYIRGKGATVDKLPRRPCFRWDLALQRCPPEIEDELKWHSPQSRGQGLKPRTLLRKVSPELLQPRPSIKSYIP